MHGSFDIASRIRDANSDYVIEKALGFALRNWKLILSIASFSAISALVFLLTAIPIYVASTQILLDTRRERTNSIDRSMSDFNYDAAGVENMITILQSSTLLERVVKDQNLLADPEFNPALVATSTSLLSTVLNPIRNLLSTANKDDTSTAPPIDLAAQQMNTAVSILRGAIAIDRAPRSFVVIISVQSIDPEKAARLANAVADAFAVDSLDARLESARRASSWLSERLTQLRAQLRESEEAVAKFRTENNLVRTANMTLNEQQLSDMNARLVNARTETAEAKVKFEQLQQVLETGGYEKAQSLPDVLRSGVIASLRSQEADVSRREADLVARYGERHPLVVNVKAEKADIQKAILAETERLAINLKNEYEVAKARQVALETNLREITGLTGSDDRVSVRLRELERTASVNKMLFEDFLSRAKLTQEQSTFEARDTRVITPAIPPGGPSYPRKTTTLLASVVVGIAIGIALALLIEILNAGFTTNEQVETLLNLPVLASVNEFSTDELTINGQSLPLYKFIKEKPLSRLSEAIRSLRTGIRMSNVDNPPQIVQVASAIPNEGKTTMALCLAYSASQSGLRVLVIDADMRNPSLTRTVGMQSNIGLVDYLVESADLNSVIHRGAAAEPDIISAGSKTNNPPDLLGSERLKDLLNHLRGYYDIIVLDSPPVGPVIDSVILSTIVDKVVVVVRWSSTARQMVAQSVAKLSNDKKVAGIVFNLVDQTRAEKYGRYAYSYYYKNRYYKNYYVE